MQFDCFFDWLNAKQKLQSTANQMSSIMADQISVLQITNIKQ